MSATIANVFGVAAAVCSVTSFAPQLIKIWKARDAGAVSLRTYALTVSCFALWIVYGVMTQAWPVTVANSLALVMSAGVLAMKWRFSRTAPGTSGSRGQDRRA
ncbi:SemiSWEET family sugar transporter [Brevundimonas lutea]|uniref:SemiSWEET family sugar transporter n=1 Tax=Brevundimonas lutea TaxID=2293980 RepID=UPI000F018806|nr:SemiSWEET family transporter [Brevundimonas lutea]